MHMLEKSTNTRSQLKACSFFIKIAIANNKHGKTRGVSACLQ